VPGKFCGSLPGPSRCGRRRSSRRRKSGLCPAKRPARSASAWAISRSYLSLPRGPPGLSPTVIACKGRYRDVVPVLALAGLRWGELAGLQAGDRVSVPGPGLRLRRTVLASGGGGALYVDTLKSTPGSDGAAGPGPAADRGSLERREGAGLVAVRRTARRPAAGVELETLGGLERGHVGCRVSPASAFMICVIRQRRRG